jgi:hypothetical protein
VAIAQEFSPRYERHRDDLVSIDVSGLERLMHPRAGDVMPGAREAEALASGSLEPLRSAYARSNSGGGGVPAASRKSETPRGIWKTIGEELRREAADRGLRVHVALASTRMAALVLACARPGLIVVDPGDEPAALAPLPIRVLRQISPEGPRDSEARRGAPRAMKNEGAFESALHAIEHWGVRTLGDLAALPPAELTARLGQQGRLWQAIARGEEVRPLVPTLPEERFESSLELEWPIEGLEPLSFVLTRLLEPLSIRLERRDRGAAVLQVALRLTTRELYVRRQQLPSPVRDVRTLRTLALLDLESHPPSAAIDRVTVTIEPTPGRVLQHTLFARPQPTPEQLSTLLARLAALMGPDRIGAAARVDSYRPGAFEMKPFATEHGPSAEAESRRSRPLISALRRCRQPVPAHVAVGAENFPLHVAASRRGFVGGAVIGRAGPWRTSGCWWEPISRGRESTLEPEAQRSASNERGQGPTAYTRGRESTLEPEGQRSASNERGWGPARTRNDNSGLYWNRDEWDVALSDGAVYRIFRDSATDAWFIDAIVD